ncbi:MAG: adenylate/guanylate cyclase domain-containing protein [Solirubrobacteraceae bacterium]
MEPDELEDPETHGERDLAAISGSAERAKRLRRFAVHVDSHSSLLSATRRLRRQLPGDEQFGDPLSTAGPQPVEVIGRTVSALQPDRKSVLAELGFAGLQVWQSLSEAAGRGRGTQEMAVMFTDLAGFSSWALKVGDGPALALLREVGTRVETTVARHDGRIVKRLGDGVMATFLQAQQAADAALDAQAEVEEIEIDGYRPSMRAGLHWGSPRKLGGDYLGVDVNVAARVGEAAKPGQVLVSDALLARVDVGGLRTGRSKRLRADGAPRDLHVVRISRD